MSATAGHVGGGSGAGLIGVVIGLSKLLFWVLLVWESVFFDSIFPTFRHDSYGIVTQ